MAYHSCPYCGTNSDEYDYEEDEIEDFNWTCESCKKTYGVLVRTEVHFRSYPDCDLNGEKHAYKSPTSWICMVCCKPREELPECP